MKIKNILSVILVSIILSNSKFAINANASNLKIINNENKQYAPINIILEQMGGKIVSSNKDITTYYFNNKNIVIDQELSFALIDGVYIPYTTNTINDWIVPVFTIPIVKEGATYVPVDFLTSNLGIKVEEKDDKLLFNKIGDNTSPIIIDINEGYKASNVLTDVVESNRPINN